MILSFINIWLSENQKNNTKEIKQYNEQFDLFKILMSNRGNTLSVEFVRAFNSIDVVFHNIKIINDNCRDIRRFLKSKDYIAPNDIELINLLNILLSNISIHLNLDQNQLQIELSEEMAEGIYSRKSEI